MADERRRRPIHSIIADRMRASARTASSQELIRAVAASGTILNGRDHEHRPCSELDRRRGGQTEECDGPFLDSEELRYVIVRPPERPCPGPFAAGFLGLTEPEAFGPPRHGTVTLSMILKYEGHKHGTDIEVQH